MKVAWIILLVSLLHSALSVDQPKISQTPKIYIYAGLGFNLAQANPLSNTADAGFKQKIFKNTYAKNRTTKDRHYLIPDNVLSKSASSCSFTPSVSIFRGTSSYKSALQKIAQYKISKLTSIDSSAFSLSPQYDKLQDLTIKQRKTIVQASSECQAYRLTLDGFKRQQFEEAFIKAVKSSFKKNDWLDFIEVYGTHYVSEVVMGGRVLHEAVFNHQSISKLRYLKIDLQNTAKARFGLLSGDKTSNSRRYQNDVKYFQYLINDKAEVILGGKSPKDGNISAWSKSVVEKSMPIGYKLVEITDLFDKIEQVEIHLKLHQVKESFTKSFTKYCKKMGCKTTKPQQAIPEPVKIRLFKSGTVGRLQGQNFTFTLKSPTAKFVKVICYAGNSIIDRIQLLFDDGVKKTYSPFFGNLGRGTLQEWTVPPQQYITQVQATYDKISLTGFGFVTNLGVKSHYFGRYFGTYSLVNIPDGYRIVGIYGQKGHFISNIGFILAKNEYPSLAAVIQSKKTQNKAKSVKL